MNTTHILIVDDDDRLRALLSKFLLENGFLVTSASDADEARKLMKSFIFDFMVLDVMMPKEDGVTFAKSLRSKNNSIPILMLTAKGELEDKISGFSSGGVDDYLTKPFEPSELLMRIKSILKRATTSKVKVSNSKLLRMGELTYDIERQELKNANQSIHLTSAENELLKIFSEHQQKIVSREALGVYTNNTDNLRTIDVQITRLRKKIEPYLKCPRYLKTVRNQGYIFIPDLD
jgi:two-component system phosphate regulon response regulator OmpR